jgi:hypothetical protein
MFLDWPLHYVCHLFFNVQISFNTISSDLENLNIFGKVKNYEVLRYVIFPIFLYLSLLRRSKFLQFFIISVIKMYRGPR